MFLQLYVSKILISRPAVSECVPDSSSVGREQDGVPSFLQLGRSGHSEQPPEVRGGCRMCPPAAKQLERRSFFVLAVTWGFVARKWLWGEAKFYLSDYVPRPTKSASWWSDDIILLWVQVFVHVRAPWKLVHEIKSNIRINVGTLWSTLDRNPAVLWAFQNVSVLDCIDADFRNESCSFQTCPN